MAALEKAKIYPKGKAGEGFYVQFNPTTLSYSISTNSGTRKKAKAPHATDPARSTDSGITQTPAVGSSRGATLSVKLFYHTYTNADTFTDVRTDVNRLRAFLRRAGDGNQVKSAPLTFAWGTITHTGTLEELSVSYQMFASDGTPVQAEVSVSIFGEDPDVTAEANDRDAAVSYESDISSGWRSGGKLPGGIQWLFE